MSRRIVKTGRNCLQEKKGENYTGRKLPFIQYIHDKSKSFFIKREIHVKLFSRTEIHMRYMYIDCVNLTHGLVACVGVEDGDVKGDYVTGTYE